MSFEKLDQLIYRPLVEADHHEPQVRAEIERAIGHRIPTEFAEFLDRYPDSGIFEVEGVVFIASADRLSGQHDGRYAVETALTSAMPEPQAVVHGGRAKGQNLDLFGGLARRRRAADAGRGQGAGRARRKVPSLCRTARAARGWRNARCAHWSTRASCWAGATRTAARATRSRGPVPRRWRCVAYRKLPDAILTRRGNGLVPIVSSVSRFELE